jgi:hypothetical protein
VLETDELPLKPPHIFLDEGRPRPKCWSAESIIESARILRIGKRVQERETKTPIQESVKRLIAVPKKASVATPLTRLLVIPSQEFVQGIFSGIV